MNIKLLIVAAVMSVVLAVSISAQDEADVPPPLPDTNFTFHPLTGVGFYVDPAKLVTLDLKMGVSLYGHLAGDLYTFSVISLEAAPFAGGFWPYLADGTRITDSDPTLDAATTWKMLQTSFEATLYQGLYYDPSRPLAQFLNIINAFVGVSCYYNYYYQNISSDSYLLKSSRADNAQWFGTVLKTGILYNDVVVNRLINTKRGNEGQVQLEWAPRQLANDLIGLTDFTRLSAYFSNNIPLVEEKDFSLYLFQRTAWDMNWGPAIPVAAQYGNAAPLQTIGYGSIRGGLLWDGRMHLASNLDIRCSFPTAFDAGIMPGFSIFWDCGFYDNYDYQFSFDRFVNTVGANFIIHLDAASIIPMSMILDLQLGVAWDLTRSKASFQFGMNLPK